MLNFVEIEPGYLAGIGETTGVHCSGMNCALLGSYDDVQLVGADDVQLVGAFGADEEVPFFKRPMVYAVAAGLLATAASGYVLGKAMAYK